MHRDIKPENVFLADEGNRRVPKLLDFGISKVRLPDMKATEVGVMMGTPAYMAPEQIRGSRDADPRTDVWALGVMLFQVLAGRLPFQATDSPALFVAIVTEDAVPLEDVAPSVPLELAHVVARCLRRSPDERYASALELARDLRLVLVASVTEEAKPQGFLFDLPTAPAPVARSSTPAAPAAKRAPSALAAGLPLPPAPDAPAAAAASPPSLGEMSGVMFAGVAASAPRRPLWEASVPPPRLDAPADDVSTLVGIAVVGLVGIGVTGALMSAAYRPEGFSIVKLASSTPDPQLRLAVQCIAAALALLLCGRACVRGVKQWKGDYADAGRTSAVVNAALAGAFLFATVQLARAAW